ncbi:Regulator of G protein signaling RGS [Orpheovirus IHUMI-LCC2]|uniref:Regulator of G protein signaling RGS n=1 Tax=Orpheovirus IHUMI-LCC2 TaxID=2023057 RepID=A0A2I2L5X5_9VIRU|nr:Regulator of G protein signaling RGS [Orpheovirus IHUMI-LCC2]SNW62955.1 Regulator of G protein signaling RGS [Orpheovirus IHUMI-LCC2]
MSCVKRGKGLKKSDLVFEKILTHIRLKRQFERFMIKEYSIENLWFYADAMAITSVQDATSPRCKLSHEEKIALVTDIYCAYFVDNNQDSLLSVPPSIQKEINSEIEKLKADPDYPMDNIFVPALEEVEGILRTKFINFIQQEC